MNLFQDWGSAEAGGKDLKGTQVYPGALGITVWPSAKLAAYKPLNMIRSVLH